MSIRLCSIHLMHDNEKDRTVLIVCQVHVFCGIFDDEILSRKDVEGLTNLSGYGIIEM